MMRGLVLGSLALVALLTCPVAARAEPTVSLGAGASLILGTHFGATLDLHGAWWMGPTWAIAVRGSAGVLADLSGGASHDPFVAQGGVGPLLRRCGRSACWGLSSLAGFQHHRMSYVDGLVQDDPWTERFDSLFVEGRLTGHLRFHPKGYVTLDASIGLRGHVLVAYDNTAGFSTNEDYWADGVASLALSGHF